MKKREPKPGILPSLLLLVLGGPVDSWLRKFGLL